MRLKCSSRRVHLAARRAGCRVGHLRNGPDEMRYVDGRSYGRPDRVPDHAERSVTPIQDDANGAFLRLFPKWCGDVGGGGKTADVGQPDPNILKRQYIRLSNSATRPTRLRRCSLVSGWTRNGSGSSLRKE